MNKHIIATVWEKRGARRGERGGVLPIENGLRKGGSDHHLRIVRSRGVGKNRSLEKGGVTGNSFNPGIVGGGKEDRGKNPPAAQALGTNNATHD